MRGKVHQKKKRFSLLVHAIRPDKSTVGQKSGLNLTVESAHK